MLVIPLTLAALLAADWAELLARTKLTLKDAMAAGLKECGEGAVVHAELEQDGELLVYSVDVARGAQLCNAVLDVSDGRLLGKELEDEDWSAALQASALDLDAAIDAALKVHPGRPVEAELDVEQGKPVVTVKIYTDAGHLVSAWVDATNGELIPLQAAPELGPPYTDAFAVDPADWTCTGTSQFFVLEPGWFLVLQGQDDGEDAELLVTVLDELKTVDGVETRVVEERERIAGELVEVSRNFVAMNEKTGDVYYFGEEVDIYEDGEVVRHEGAWLSGVGGARFGLLMPGKPVVGQRFHQEIAPEVAMDRAEILSLEETFETPAETFPGCLKVRESTPLEEGSETKHHAPGIGLVQDEGLLLVRYGRP